MAKSLNIVLHHHAGGLADGIYLDLPAEAYHADSALGSSDIRTCRKGANQYWHRSGMNPNRPEQNDDTPSKILGRALHDLLLEGEGKLRKYFVRRPDDPKGATPAEKGALTKKANASLLAHQELLKGDDWTFITSVKSILDEDPELKGCLDNGLSEVSVFWTRPDGVRVKARFDKLKLRGIGDIKSIANERERELEMACKLDIHTYRYDMQAAHYMEARRQLPALVKANKINKPNGFDELNKDDVAKLEFLRAVADQRAFAFQFVFIPKTGAPDAWSCVLSPGNPIIDGAVLDLERGIDNYKHALERFGSDKRWLPLRPVSELDVSEMPFGFGRN